jgi:hypothetical protein
MLTVTFDELEGALAASDSTADAAEAHGSLCGSLAASAGFSPDDWADQLLPEPALRPAVPPLLVTVFQETREALLGGDLEFAPILPDDHTDLSVRVQALAAWCSGFLVGFGLANTTLDAALPDVVNEVLRDFGEISRAIVDDDEDAESSEFSYAELVEHLRVSAQLVFEELIPIRDAKVRP